MSVVLRVDDFYAANRGGGLFSEAVSQRLGAVIAYFAARAGLKPTVVTLANLALGLATSTTVALTASTSLALSSPTSLALTSPAPLLGLLALLGWQIAYAMDCADGQLARVTGQASPAGARVDVLCDVASHIALVTALVLVAKPPLWLAALFAGTWMVNIITSILATGGGVSGSLVPSRAASVRVLKLIRDYGALVFLAGLILILNPAWMLYFLVLMTVTNGVFLLVSVTHSARMALA